jgi:alkyl hydroperoxide reductase subunit AhpC
MAKKQYVIDVGDEIPDFMLDSQVGKINFKPNMEGRWALLLTFGLSYDPVATTDIGMMAKLADEFDARNVSIFAIGCDTGKIYNNNR